METCSGERYKNAHEEIVFDRGNCPLCAALDEIKELENKVKELENKIE